MNCRYCGARNHESDHRCLRCGRRIHAAAARPAPEFYTSADGSALRAPLPHGAPAAGAQAEPKPRPEPDIKRPVQQPLFTAREMAGAIPSSQANRSRVLSAKIVSMDGYVSGAPEVRPVAEPPRPRTSGRVHQAGGRGSALAAQRALEFTPPAVPRVIPAQAPAAVCCAAPVALPMHRFIAGFLDYSLISIAVGLLFLPLLVTPAGDLITMETLPFMGLVAVLIGFAYKMLWAALGTESPGMKWVALRVLNFDGLRPTRQQRITRVVSGLLSVAAAGLGLLWTLADEETLSWHDHISKTFVTPHARV